MFFLCTDVHNNSYYNGLCWSLIHCSFFQGKQVEPDSLLKAVTQPSLQLCPLHGTCSELKGEAFAAWVRFTPSLAWGDYNVQSGECIHPRGLLRKIKHVLSLLFCFPGFVYPPPPHGGESSLDEAAAVRPISVRGLYLQWGSLQAASVMLKVLKFLVVHLFFLSQS